MACTMRKVASAAKVAQVRIWRLVGVLFLYLILSCTLLIRSWCVFLQAPKAIRSAVPVRGRMVVMAAAVVSRNA